MRKKTKKQIEIEIEARDIAAQERKRRERAEDHAEKMRELSGDDEPVWKKGADNARD